MARNQINPSGSVTTSPAVAALGSPSATNSVAGWLERARGAIPQYERDVKRAEWMFRRMEAFSRVHGERLALIRLEDVLAYLETLTRRGENEWQVGQALDSICILLSFGCGRHNVRMSEVREQWLVHRDRLMNAAVPAGARDQMFEMPITHPPGSILDRLARRTRLLHYARRTELAYCGWWKRFVEFSRPVAEDVLGDVEAGRFLEHMAVERRVSASTQSQALNAVVFVFKEVLGRPLGTLEMARAKPSKRLPVVLTRDEVSRLLAELSGTYSLIGRLLYGSGLRLLECLRLRVKDVEFH